MGRDSPIPLDEKEYCARTRFEPRELVLENFGVLSVEGAWAGYLIGIVTVCGMIGGQVAFRVVVHCAGASSLGEGGDGGRGWLKWGIRVTSSLVVFLGSGIFFGKR
jgi:hypothetical protein